MRIRDHIIPCLALLLCELLNARAYGRPISGIDTQKLAESSPLVVVADVESTTPMGAVEFLDHTRGQHMLAVLQVDEALKGKPNTNMLSVEYDLNPDPMAGGPWTQSLWKGKHMVLFLSCGKVCAPTNPEQFGFEVPEQAVDVPAPTVDSVTNRILQRLAARLFLAVRTESQNYKGNSPAIWLLQQQRNNPYVDSLLHAALAELQPNEGSGNLRCELLAAVLARGDLDVLPELAHALALGNGVTSLQQNMVYALQGKDWHRTLPIAAFALQSSSAEVRVAAARALQNLDSKPPALESSYRHQATALLLTALSDPNPQVVFASMQSLGYLNEHLEQRPKTSYSDKDWRECLDFWQQFSNP